MRIVNYLAETGAIEIREEAPFFKWSSGIESPIYCDNRKLLSFPEIRSAIIDGFVAKINKEHVDAICGVATAGISWGALIADRLDMPFLYVRSKAKEHGQNNQIEGSIKDIKNVLVIEDLISTGKSSLVACNVLKNAGLNIQKVWSIFSYNLSSAKENFQESNIAYESLANMDDLLSSEILSNKQKENLRDFIC